MTHIYDVDGDEAKRLNMIKGKNDIALRKILCFPRGRSPEIAHDEKASHPKDDDRASITSHEHGKG